MKITFLRRDRKNQSHRRLVTLNELARLVMKDASHGEIEKLRTFVHRLDRDYRYEGLQYLPRVYPAVELYEDKDHNYQMRQFNGLLTLSIGPLRESEEVARVKERVALLPMTAVALVGSSGRTVKVVVATSRPDGSLPTTADEAERFCQRAFPLICSIYEAALRSVPTAETPLVGPAQDADSNLLHTGFRLTLDETPFFRIDAAPISIADNLPIGQAGETETIESSAPDANSAVGKETRQLISFLESCYALRMNSVMGYVEYRDKQHWHRGWQPVDERAQNQMAMLARMKGINVWDKDVRRFLQSNMVRIYDPVEEYLGQARGKWDGRDHIGRLAATIPTDNPNWKKWFRIWFLGMVAQWIGKDNRYGNSLVPLLVSKQGYNKSTFCKSLIPLEMQWGYNDNLLLSEKKAVLQAMNQFLLINLDEFNQISTKIQGGFLKNVVQMASVKVRRPFGRHVEDMPRRASFIATANVSDVLSDPTGSRRFIGIELTGPIDTSYRIDHTQLYAQALALLDRGERYWLDEEQTQLVMESNRQYQLRSPEEIFFYECFEIPQRAEDGEWWTASQIFLQIKRKAKSAIPRGNVATFGRILKNMPELQRRKSRKGAEYLVKLIGE